MHKMNCLNMEEEEKILGNICHQECILLDNLEVSNPGNNSKATSLPV